MIEGPRCYRALIVGRRGAAAANHPLAAQAGLMALRAGGNAVDAAVATALALAVVEPMMSGLGGDAFYHVFDAKRGKSVVFNGLAPRRAPRPRNATPPASRAPDRYRCRCRGCSPGSA
jgi:gamma-glutamyltranspeptidase/glutathione hydrolase